MQANINSNGRMLRATLGIFILISAVLLNSPLMTLVGLFTLYEAATSWCVVNQLLGKNECSLLGAKRPVVPFLRQQLIGWAVLSTAIAANVVASWLGWVGWYEWLRTPDKILSLDNYVYLFIVYPLLLGTVARATTFFKTN